jgi:predicted nucleic-acid-binding protein
MIGLDTNVLVRYLAQDDPVQSPLATTLVESLTPDAPGYVTLVTLVETVWVLARRYEATRADLVRVIETLLRTRELSVESAETAWRAVRLYAASSADFADCLIVRACREAGCEYTVTFDARASRTAGMRIIG